MTSDLETTTDDLYTTIRALFQEAQGSAGDDLPSSGFGQKVASVADVDVASATGLDLAAVREYLDNANGVQLVVERDGETRKVTGLL
jgi:outer membrane lipoprotein SlyB